MNIISLIYTSILMEIQYIICWSRFIFRMTVECWIPRTRVCEPFLMGPRKYPIKLILLVPPGTCEKIRTILLLVIEDDYYTTWYQHLQYLLCFYLAKEPPFCVLLLKTRFEIQDDLIDRSQPVFRMLPAVS